MTEPAHYKYGPSSASRWINCPASVQGEQPFDDSNEQSRRGTLGHAITESLLRFGEARVPEDLAETLQFLQADSEQWAEFIDAVNLCVRFVKTTVGNLTEPFEIFYEIKIKADWVEDHGGTIDVLIVTPNTLHIVDYKFGRVLVDVKDNDQLQCYLNLARQEFSGREKFFASIVQPVWGEGRTVEFPEEQLKNHRLKVESSIANPSIKRADPGYCQYCPHIMGCAEPAKLALQQLVAVPTLEEVTAQTPVSGPTTEQVALIERLHKVYKMSNKVYEQTGPILKAWHDAGVKLEEHSVTKRRIAKWQPEAYVALTEMFPDGDHLASSQPPLKTPVEIRKMLGLSKREFEKKHATILELSEQRVLRSKGDEPRISDFDDFDTSDFSPFTAR
jgi:hypothetical protein